MNWSVDPTPFLEWWQVLAGFFGFLVFMVMTDPPGEWW